MINVKPTTNPINITLLDGQTIMSTHTCNLDIPWLLAFIPEAHIVPGIAHSSLISINMFCSGGSKVIYNKTEVRVIYNRKTGTLWRTWHAHMPEAIVNLQEGYNTTREKHGVRRAWPSDAHTLPPTTGTRHSYQCTHCRTNISR